MFRRSRLSIRPNVGTSGRTAGSSQETSSNTGQDNTSTTFESHASVNDNKSADPPTEQAPGIEQSGEAASSSAIQRRKRFSVRPKVVPGRPSALPRTPKSPIKPVIPSVKSPVPVINKTDILIEADCTAPLQELLTSKECQTSNESRLAKIDSVSPSECSSKCLDQPIKLQSSSCSQLKEISPKAPVPPSIPDREAIDISEKAKTLVSKTELKTSSQHFSLTQLLNDKSDLLRLEKARKLRQLLKQEMLKEKSKKYMARVKEYTLDPSKMTMRDLIHYLPTSNPMSTLEAATLENETVIPQSPEREASPERAQEEEVHSKMLSPGQGEATATTLVEGEQELEEEEAEEAAEDEEALMVPQVKVAEDGSLIIDEESLTVEVQRMKGPNPIQDRDPIFERGSTTTYSSFRKGTHTKPWSTEETDMFFLAISMVGTDFAMISQLFPHRARAEIKNKFKKEERHNAWRIDKAFRERRRLDLEYFKKLLEKILEFQRNKKKLKSMSEKPKTSKRKTKVKKAVVELSDVDEQNEDGVSIEEQEGEKENLCNEKTSSSKTKGKRKRKDVLSSESPVDKKRNKRENKKMSDDAGALADLEEGAIPEDHLSLDQAKRTETEVAKTAEAKSLPLSRKGQKVKKSKAVISDTEGETTSEETMGQQSTKRMSDNDSSNHETTVQSTKQSRYGRISKPVEPLNYPTKEDTNSSASDTLASPAHQTAAAKAKNKTSGKRRRSAQQKTAKESKKPKLITLRASQSEGSDDDEEETEGQHYDDDNGTSAFVPASLCSPKPVVPEVQETMEELDMLAHMPDVLGMSKNALCPNASCEQVQNERGTVEPCEHQLDLLVDVIDFLSEHTEASGDESYNEAAQTLLEIGNMANIAQPTESQPPLSDHISKCESSPCSEVNDLTKSMFEQEECAALISEASKTENIPTNRPMEQPPPSLTSDTQICQPSGELSNTEDTDLSTQVSAETAKNSLPTRKGRLSKIKPKPNVGSSTRTTKRLTQPIDVVLKSQEVEIATTSQHQTLEQREESTLAVFETDHGPAADTTLMSPISHVSNIQVSHEPCCKQDTVASPQLHTTSEPKINSSPPTRQSLSNIKPNISCGLRTTKQTVEAVEENPQVESEIPSTTQLRSLEHQEESTVLEQNEFCSPQGTAATQLEPFCAKNSSSPRKGRLSKIKPKPNIGCASRSKKLSPQISHGIEDKIQDESEMASTSQCASSEHQVECTQTLSEQSDCKCKNETDGMKENMPASQSSDTQVIKHCDAPSSMQDTAPISQLGTPCSKNSTVPRTERFSKIKAKPNTASRTTKPSSQSADITEEKQTAGKTAIASQLESVVLPLSESEVGSCVDFNSKETEGDQSNRIVLTCEISRPQEPGEEPSTLEKHLDQFAEMSCTPSVLCAVEPLEQPRPFENVTSLEPEIISLPQNDQSSAEEKTEKITSVKPSDPPSSESLKHSTPQRRRWIPKIKPKPNLVSSLRTANTKLESKEITQASDHLVESSLLNAISEQPVLRDRSTANPHNNLQSVTVESNSASTVPLMGEETINVSKTAKIHENPAKVQESCELSAANQTNTDHCNFTDCVPFVSSKSSTTRHQFEDLALNNTEICAVRNFHVETCDFSTEYIRPAESAVEPSTELQHTDVAPVFGPGQMQDSSVQNPFEYKSLLFPNIPPDQVPSDPDEPFFILSLTEIPVCPSGEEVNPRPESYHALPDTKGQQSNPVEPVVPVAAGIDDSLSNIHIPTPEKATLKSELICVEQYLPSTPSVDISLLEEPQENSSVRRLNLTESGSNIEHSDTLPADKQPSIRGDVEKSSRRANLTRKTAAKKTNKHEDTAQDPPEPFTQIKCSEVVDSQAQQDSDGSSVIRKIKTYEARGNKSRTKNSKASGDPVWGGTEMHSSEEPTPNVLSCSFSSKDNQSTSSSSALLDPNQSDSTNVLDEGPTDVLEYFFGDVFTEVESDCSVTGNTTGDTACCDKTQSQPAETKVNLRQHSSTPCGQQSPITAAPQKPETTADEATSSNLPGSAVTEETIDAIDSNQQDNRKSKGRGKGNTKRKSKTGEAKSGNSRPQRKSTATIFPPALFQDNLKENTSSSSSIQPQTHETDLCGSLQNTSEILDSNQSNSVGSSFLEEEPTNVSQYFFSDVFTEVESNDFSVQGKPNSNSSCSSTAPSQKAETKVDERDKSDPRSGQHSPLTEAQPPDTTNLQNIPSSIDVTTTDSSKHDAKMTRGKRNSKKKSNICESLRNSTETLKTPETVLQDSLIETQSSSAVQPENLRGCLSGSSEVPVQKNDHAVEVDCGHTSVKGTINDDVASGETQTQTSETSGSTGKKRQTKASSGPPLIQEPALHASVTPEAQKTTVDPSHDKKEKGKGRLNRKNKPSDGATAKCSRPQRQNTAASKSPVRVKETLSDNASTAQVELQGTNMSDIKESSPFDDEPTNVSQYFLSDIFTDVDEEFK